MPMNEFGQPVGAPLEDWVVPSIPGSTPLIGRTTRLEPLDPATHGPALWEAFADAPDSLWTYMSFGPFADADEFAALISTIASTPELMPLVVTVDGRPLGFACFMRIEPAFGVVEIGSISFAPALQRTTAATEALDLMLTHVFDLGYRRCEWKCDDRNAPSRAAATRLGFTYEGTFRSAMHYKGRNRDTAWFSIIDSEWPELRASLDAWLAPGNFDGDGAQRRRLQEFR